MSLSLSVTTPPTVEPLSLQEAKDHLRVGGTDDDELIKVLISAARERCETETSRAIAQATYRMVMDSWTDTQVYSLNEKHRGGYHFPYGCGDFYTPIEMQVPPLVSVTSITYVDVNGVTQTIDPTTYRVDTDTTPGRVIPLDHWPNIGTQYAGIRINFVAGYVTVPASIKQAMLLIVGSLYENRENISDRQMFEIPTSATYLLSSQKWGRYR